MMISYKIFDRLHEWTKNYTDLKERRAIEDELATFDQAKRDELVRYAEDRASKWKEGGEKAIAGLWERFAELVRRAGPG